MVVCFCISANVVRADQITVPSYTQGYLTIPNVGTFYSWKNPASDTTAYVEMVLNPGNSFSSNCWDFVVNSEDTSQWTMSFYSSIWLNTVQAEFNPLNTKSIIKDAASLIFNVRMFNNGDMNEDGLTRSYTLSDFFLKPSDIISTSLAYDNVAINCDGIVRQNWLLTYQVSGQFSAGTLAEAQAIGAQFASVPEPGTIALLLAAAIASGSCWLYRKR